MQVRQAVPQTEQIDERIRLRYLAHGITEVALLKLQRFPTDFYHVWEYKQAGVASAPYLNFVYAPEFEANAFLNDSDQPSSHFNDSEVVVSLQRIDMSTATDTYWKEQVFVIKADASYQDRRGRHISAESVRTVRSTRRTLGP